MRGLLGKELGRKVAFPAPRGATATKFTLLALIERFFSQEPAAVSQARNNPRAGAAQPPHSNHTAAIFIQP